MSQAKANACIDGDMSAEARAEDSKRDRSGGMNEPIDVAKQARRLRIPQLDLVRELQSDGVPVLRVSAKRFRVDRSDFDQWVAKRTIDTANAIANQKRRADYVIDHQPAQCERVKFNR